jgi:hypothetical protein
MTSVDFSHQKNENDFGEQFIETNTGNWSMYKYIPKLKETTNNHSPNFAISLQTFGILTSRTEEVRNRS